MLRLPAARRARGFRLYAKPDIRLVDLWQRDGFAYLGHNPRGLSTKLKNRISQATWSPFPSTLQTRCLGLAAKLFPDKVPLFFRNLDALANFAVEQNFALPPVHGHNRGHDNQLAAPAALAGQANPGLPGLPGLPESMLAVRSGQRLQLIRPNAMGLLSSRSQEFSPQDWLLPILPTLDPSFGALLLVPKDRFAQIDSRTIPAAELSPVAAEIWLWALAAVSASAPLPTPRDALPIPENFPLHAPLFNRQGRYLLPKATKQAYPALYRLARKRGLLLSPRVGGISILPAWASRGEWDAIRKLLELEAEQLELDKLEIDKLEPEQWGAE